MALETGVTGSTSISGVQQNVSMASVDLPAFVPVRRHIGSYVEMLISSLLSLFASLVLSVDAIILAKNPDAIFSCDINAKISCGTVGQSWQANLFGWPNAFLGLIAEPVVITLAVAALGGVRFPRWFMLLAQAVYTIGFAFALWLFYEAYFHIGALCPWCLLVTATTTLVWMSLTRVNILDGNLRIGEWAVKACRNYLDIGLSIIILVAMGAMIFVQYL